MCSITNAYFFFCGSLRFWHHESLVFLAGLEELRMSSDVLPAVSSCRFGSNVVAIPSGNYFTLYLHLT